jgi:hypothetical protein
MSRLSSLKLKKDIFKRVFKAKDNKDFTARQILFPLICFEKIKQIEIRHAMQLEKGN